MTDFPSGFLWGASTAGHQVEGGNVNADLWPLEWAPNSMFTEPSGDACDHYHRFEEDLTTLADLGLNAYRFSLEWSRIEPEDGFVSRAALDHYVRVVEACLERGITAVVTYNHFTLPRWLAGRRGWHSTEAPERFAAFAGAATRALGGMVDWACTLNEPNLLSVVAAMGPKQHDIVQYADMPRGDQPAPLSADEFVQEPSDAAPETSPARGIGGFDNGTYQMGMFAGDVEVMARAHRLASQAIKAEASKMKVGWTIALPHLVSIDGGEERRAAAERAGEVEWLEVSAADDFVGVQTYSRDIFGPQGRMPVPDEALKMQTGWEAYPAGLEHTVRLAASTAGVPVLVTENGMATHDDTARISYTKDALEGLARCVKDGVDVRGYLHWSLLDNFEWFSGYAMTFGLIAVDRETFDRTVKPSARWLGQVAQRNGMEC